jgi:predicted glycogen debranching enzyme
MPTSPQKDQLIRLGSTLCTRLDEAESREWLLADGLGGYASGTIAGPPTRRYHGLLLAATDPPAGRTLLVHSIHERILIGDQVVELGAARWADGSVNPHGYERLSCFVLEGRTPTWTWAVGDIRIQRRIALEKGIVEIRWSLDGTSHPVHLEYTLLVSNRSHHALLQSGGTRPSTKIKGGNATITLPGDTPRTLHVAADGELMTRGTWWKGFQLAEEKSRGYPDVEDAWEALACEVVVPSSGDVRLRAGLDAKAVAQNENLVTRAREADEACAHAAGAPSTDSLQGRLAIAADQFLVKRPLPEGGESMTIIAGYPWFADWGRDAMISLPGLTLATGRSEDAASILETFAAHEQDGLIPNLFTDDGSPPLYNTVDASLLFIEAVRRWYEVTEDETRLRGLWPTIDSIITHYKNGTLHGIGVDESDGLLHAGEQGLQLTWMDARVGTHVITPRRGKPVEINALWHAALHTAATLAKALGEDPTRFEQDANRVRESYDKFWNQANGCLFDVIEGHGGNDDSIRPNQLFALALHPPLLEEDRARSVLEVVKHELVVPMGVRTLDSGSERFAPRYEGSPKQRDAEYHQGTAWPWLLGPWLSAQIAVHGDAAQPIIDDLLKQAEAHLRVAGLGSVSEILDATSPYTPRGCTAQAWSVAVLLDMNTRRSGSSTPAEAATRER